MFRIITAHLIMYSTFLSRNAVTPLGGNVSFKIPNSLESSRRETEAKLCMVFYFSLSIKLFWAQARFMLCYVL